MPEPPGCRKRRELAEARDQLAYAALGLRARSSLDDLSRKCRPRNGRCRQSANLGNDAGMTTLLFHWRILPPIVRGLPWPLKRTLNVGGAVGLATAAKIFLGMVRLTASL
jgi:hypothetical protein